MHESRKELLMSVSRVYADVVSNMPEGYSDYDTVSISWQYLLDIQGFNIIDHLSVIRSFKK